MRYLSTRGGPEATAAGAIVAGISDSGGLYVPALFPKLDVADVCRPSFGYRDVALAVMQPYLKETPENTLRTMIADAYKSFDTPDVVPLHALTGTESVAELWHGPTMAFKDVALQMLPRLMVNALRETGETKQIYILVATSGDTGKAALEGFRDVPGTRVLVFYPFGGVSRAQRLQMVTQDGNNVDVCAVRGNFDDAQTGVKKIFADRAIKTELGRAGYRLSSANSINFGRLLPQIVYYYTSYANLVAAGQIQPGDPVNFCVPTGNFGDILAGEYARCMGLPIRRLICASNRNNVLTDFFRTGVYNCKRPFQKSMSCSIDILISSNLERLLFELADRDPDSVRRWMTELRERGNYRINNEMREWLAETFVADWCSEADTLATIKRVFDTHGYLMDPHTAVAQTVYERYFASTGDATKTVLLSTANPYKFASDVFGAFGKADADDFENVRRLSELTGMPVPAGISGLMEKAERHLDVCDLAGMPKRVMNPILAQ